jgi:ATP phosphoribosyltransferase
MEMDIMSPMKTLLGSTEVRLAIQTPMAIVDLATFGSTRKRGTKVVVDIIDEVFSGVGNWMINGEVFTNKVVGV